MNNPPYTTGGHRDWDLIAAMLFFIACCLLVSLVLPYRHYGVPAGHAAAEQLPAPRPAPIALVTSPQQKNAALAAYREGMQALRADHYPAALIAFKKALEKFPGFAEAYIGLGEANHFLGDDQAAALNAQHGLDEITADQTAFVPDLDRQAARAWAHRVLGTALLRRAERELDQHEHLLAKMAANRARFHCQQALALGHGDSLAEGCTETAAALAQRS
ncbi:MAG: hypothetical protein AABZ84_09160 [Pseudomonadota bacterium]|mgnify:CR=1 FL=1